MLFNILIQIRLHGVNSFSDSFLCAHLFIIHRFFPKCPPQNPDLTDMVRLVVVDEGP